MNVATITFDLNDPDSLISWKQVVHASTMASVLYEFKNNFMKRIEWGLDSGEDPYDCVLKHLNEVLEPIDAIAEEFIQ